MNIFSHVSPARGCFQDVIVKLVDIFTHEAKHTRILTQTHTRTP